MSHSIGHKRALCVLLLAALGLWAIPARAQSELYTPKGCAPDEQGTVFVPIDNWIYPALDRLAAMGYLDTGFLGIRPWTRAAIANMLVATGDAMEAGRVTGARHLDDAEQIARAVAREIGYKSESGCRPDEDRSLRLESTYTTLRGLTGDTLRDSYHLGSTLINDFGRPYQNGFDSYTGLSARATRGRFALYARGEFDSAPSGAGYSTALAQALSGFPVFYSGNGKQMVGLAGVDLIPFSDPTTGTIYSQPTIPMGPISERNNGRLLEAYLSANLAGHVISFGKTDQWLGPARGGAMAYSNNAEAVWALHIDRTEPLDVPGLSRLFGPFRYEFLVGPLHGHTYIPPTTYTTADMTLTTTVLPGSPWVHVEKVSLQPTRNLEVGFERTVIWGGKGHEPITLHTFLRSFFSISAPNGTVKDSSADPGARFGAFDFRYRLPGLRNWLTLYSDSEVHDDVSPIDAPRRASIRPGLYLSHVPGLPRLDVRAEAVMTDPSISNSQGGHFMYWETMARQGYTNQGQMFGDWIGREDKGGQAWIGWHLSPREWIEASYRHQKAAKDFIPGGTTLNEFSAQVVKRIHRDLEVNGRFSVQGWKAPIYPTGTPQYPAQLHRVTATTIQLTWFPEKKIPLFGGSR